MKPLLHFKFLIFAVLFSLTTLIAQEKAQDFLIKAEGTTNTDSAFIHYNTAEKLAEVEENKVLIDSIYFAISRRYISIGQMDTARIIAKKRLNIYTDPNKNPLAPGFYNLIAASYHHQNKLDSASMFYIKAIEILELKKDTLKAAKLRFNLANIFLSYKDYDQAAQEFSNTIAVMQKYKDSSNLAGAISALATCKLQLDEISTAKILTEEALTISLIRNDIVGQMLSYRQIGQIEEQENALDNSLINYTKAYELAQITKLPYYIAMIEMNLCEVYTRLNDAKNSLTFCTKSLEASQSNQFASHLKSLYTNLSKSYELNGDFENAFLYVNKANEIREKELNEENKGIVNELVIKYETEQKDKQILEQKLSLAKQERQNFISASLALIAFIGIGVLILLYYYRNKLNSVKLIQINQEKEREVLKAILKGEESERNRLAVDLHDGISNLLFSCKLSLTSITSNEPIIQSKITDNIQLIDDIRLESRRMAHNLMPLNFSSEKLELIFREYVQRMDEVTTDTNLSFQNFGENNTSLNDNVKLILFRSIQELIGNALKHAKAKEIDLQLFYHDKSISITLSDDGVGFLNSEPNHGKGLSSMKSRLNSIDATLEIDSTESKGTNISIKLPL
jgi:signal transduction histidine kinase